MAEPIRKTVSIIDKDFSPGSGDNRILSLELLPNGIAYVILNASDSKFYSLEAFETGKRWHSMLHDSAWLQSVIDSIPALNEHYQRVHLALNPSQLVLLPEGLYADLDIKNAFNFSCGNTPDSIIRSDRMKHMQGFGVYAIQKELHQFIDSLWPGSVFYHSGAIFIERLLASAKILGCPDIALHIRSSYFEVLLLEHASLSFYQAFQFEQDDDLLYYLFHVLDVFDKEASSMNLMIAGEIGADTDLCRRLRTYFKEVQFYSSKDACTCSPAFDALPGHYFANLLYTEACE